MVRLDVIPPGPEPGSMLVPLIVALVVVVIIIVALVKVMGSRSPRQ